MQALRVFLIIKGIIVFEVLAGIVSGLILFEVGLESKYLRSDASGNGNHYFCCVSGRH